MSKNFIHNWRSAKPISPFVCSTDVTSRNSDAICCQFDLWWDLGCRSSLSKLILTFEMEMKRAQAWRPGPKVRLNLNYFLACALLGQYFHSMHLKIDWPQAKNDFLISRTHQRWLEAATSGIQTHSSQITTFYCCAKPTGLVQVRCSFYKLVICAWRLSMFNRAPSHINHLQSWTDPK